MLSGKSVLILDNSRLGGLVVRNTILRDSRLHVVGIASDLKQGGELIENTQPDLVIVDSAILEEEDYQFLRNLKSVAAKSLLLANVDSNEKKVSQLGADEIMVKKPRGGLPIATWQGTEILRKIYEMLGLPEPQYSF